MIRWKGLIFIAILVGLFFVAGLFLTDSLIESVIEGVATDVNGALVEIDNLDISLSDLLVSMDRIQVTDRGNTMKNAIETGLCRFDVEFWPLFSGKVIIENFDLTGLKFGTARETDGKLNREVTKTVSDSSSEDKKSKSKKDAPKDDSAFASYTAKINTDSLLALVNIESVEKIENLKSEIQTKYGDLNTQLQNAELSKEITAIETEIKNLDLKDLKDLKKLQSTLKDLEKTKKSVDELNKKYNSLRKNSTDDLNKISNDIKQVDEWVATDYANILDKAQIPDLSAQNIGKMLFGESIINRFNEYLGYAAIARKYGVKLKSDKPEKEDPPRFKGQDIYFYRQNARPDFWLKNMNISGEYDGLVLGGKALDIVSDQRLINKQTELEIAGSQNPVREFAFNGNLNYLEDIPSEKFNLKYSGFSLNNISISESNMMPGKIESGIGSINALLDMEGDEIRSEISFAGDKLVVAQDESYKPANKMQSIISETILSVTEMSVKAQITGKKDDYSISVKSNLDDLLAQKLKSIASREVNEAKEKLKNKLDQKITKSREELNSIVTTNKQKIEQQLDQYKQQIDDNMAMLNEKKKSVEDKIDKEKKKAGNKLKDALKF